MQTSAKQSIYKSKSSISEILAFFTTALCWFVTKHLTNLHIPKPLLIFASSRTSDSSQWYTQKYSGCHINFPLHRKFFLNQAVIGDSDYSPFSGQVWVSSKLGPRPCMTHLNYHVLSRLPSDWQLPSGFWPWWQRLFRVRPPLSTARLGFSCEEDHCCSCVGKDLDLAHPENCE